MINSLSGRARKIEILVHEVRKSVTDKPMFADSWHAELHNVSITFVENVRRSLKISSVKEQRQESVRKGEQWHHRAGIVISNKDFGTWTVAGKKVKHERVYTKTEQYWTKRVQKINKRNSERFHLVKKTIENKPELTLKEIAYELDFPYYFVVNSSTIILAGLADKVNENTQISPLVIEAQETRKKKVDLSRRKTQKSHKNKDKPRTKKA